MAALGVLALLGGLAGGLLRLGWSVPFAPLPAVAFHGPLMVAGFLGTVIGLERAVALGRAWGYGAPLASGLGALAVLTGVPGGPWLMLLGSALMVLVFGALLRRQATLFMAIMALGALAWLAGQVAWVAGQPIARVVAWWAGFLVLTIAGERLELTRLVRIGAAARTAFVVIVVVLLGGLAVATQAPEPGVTMLGVALLALAAWLARFDIARRTARASGLTRFIALALLGGYAWLAVAGGLAVRWPGAAAGGIYDAILHALFVGFVFSMILGHAPTIVPALMGVRIGYRPAFYAPLGLLHLSLALRVAGDLAPWPPGRQWGGLLNVVAIALFFATLAHAAVRSRSAR